VTTWQQCSFRCPRDTTEIFAARSNERIRPIKYLTARRPKRPGFCQSFGPTRCIGGNSSEKFQHRRSQTAARMLATSFSGCWMIIHCEAKKTAPIFYFRNNCPTVVFFDTSSCESQHIWTTKCSNAQTSFFKKLKTVSMIIPCSLCINCHQCVALMLILSWVFDKL